MISGEKGLRTSVASGWTAVRGLEIAKVVDEGMTPGVLGSEQGRILLVARSYERNKGITTSKKLRTGLLASLRTEQGRY